MDYDFIVKPDNPPESFAKTPIEVGPNLTETVKMTPLKFAESVLKVYHKLGAEAWLFKQATAAPAEFMKLLARLLPKQLELGGLDGLQVTLIDQFGNKAIIETKSVAATGKALTPPVAPRLRPGQPDKSEVATSGSPDPTPKVSLVEEF